jgi:hypothetical protein
MNMKAKKAAQYAEGEVLMRARRSHINRFPYRGS